MINANKPNFWRVDYLVSLGTFDRFERVTKTVENLTELLYSIARDKIRRITPLFLTEDKFPELKPVEIDSLYDDMRSNIEIKKWTEQLVRGNKIVENAELELSKLHKS